MTAKCPGCGLKPGWHQPGCSGGTVKVPVPPFNENLRHAADVLTKWSIVMCDRWTSIRERIEAFGATVPRNLELGKHAVLEAGLQARLLIKLKGTWVVPSEALQSPFFDPSVLPLIRNSVFAALTDFERKIEEARAIFAKGQSASIPTPAPASGNIIDEFGADIMQYGPFKKEPARDRNDPSYSFKADPNTGFFQKGPDIVFANKGVLQLGSFVPLKPGPGQTHNP